MKKPIESAPKDRAILLHFPDLVRPPQKLPNGATLRGYTRMGGWIEAWWVEDKDWKTDEDGLNGHQVGGWEVLKLPVHGCDCCSSDNEEPDFWMELPR